MITNQNKHKHPIASKIPTRLWETHFNSKLNENDLLILKKNISQIALTDFENETQALILIIINYNYASLTLLQLLGLLKFDLTNYFYIILCASATAGRIDLLQTLKDQYPTFFSKLLSKDLFLIETIGDAFEHGQLESIKWFKKNTPHQLHTALLRDAIYPAGINGHLNILEWFKEENPDQIIPLLKYNNYAIFNSAIEKGHLEVLQWIKKQIPSEIMSDMINRLDNDSLFLTLLKGNKETANWLISEPDFLKYDSEYGEEPVFIKKFLNDLHQKKEASEANFDLTDPEAARLYFYLMRYLIKPNNPECNKEFNFLLTIPSIRALADEELSSVHPSGLLRLAKECSNTTLVTSLNDVQKDSTLSKLAGSDLSSDSDLPSDSDSDSDLFSGSDLSKKNTIDLPLLIAPIQKEFEEKLELLYKIFMQQSKGSKQVAKAKVLYDDLSDATVQFFKTITPDSTEEEIRTNFKLFKSSCLKHSQTADKVMGHGWLFRAVEVVAKALGAVLVGMGMAIGSLMMQGFAKESHREWYKNTFFTLHKTYTSKALESFNEKDLSELESQLTNLKNK